MVDRDGDGYAFGNVVDCDCDDDRKGYFESVEGGDEGCHAFGEVVDADGKGEHYAGAFEVVVGPAGFEFGEGVGFVRIFVGGNEPVDQRDEGYSGEEGAEHGRGGPAVGEDCGEPGGGLRHEFHERDVDHDAG